MGDTARYSTLHRFAELEKRSRLVRKGVSYSWLALFARCFSLSLLYYILSSPWCKSGYVKQTGM
jgi:hypothetical protein